MWIYHKSYPLRRRKAIPHVVFQGRQLSYKSACTTSCKRQVNSFQFSITHCEPELCSIQLFKAAKKKKHCEKALWIWSVLSPLSLSTLPSTEQKKKEPITSMVKQHQDVFLKPTPFPNWIRHSSCSTSMATKCGCFGKLQGGITTCIVYDEKTSRWLRLKS